MEITQRVLFYVSLDEREKFLANQKKNKKKKREKERKIAEKRMKIGFFLAAAHQKKIQINNETKTKKKQKKLTNFTKKAFESENQLRRCRSVCTKVFHFAMLCH